MTLRSRIELAIVRHLLEGAQRHNIKLVSVDDGEEDTKVKTTDEALHLIFNLDECTLRFDRGRWVKLILGNGEDIIGDYGVDAKFDKLMDELNELTEKGVISFTTCTVDKPAWKTEHGRGVCINCGGQHD